MRTTTNLLLSRTPPSPPQAAAPTSPRNIKTAQPGQRRSPLLQAYIDEGDDDVRVRIEKFERESTTKALVIISFFSAVLLGKDYLGLG